IPDGVIFVPVARQLHVKATAVDGGGIRVETTFEHIEVAGQGPQIRERKHRRRRRFNRAVEFASNLEKTEKPSSGSKLPCEERGSDYRPPLSNPRVPALY